MEQQHAPQEIYFKDLLFAALYRWKIAIVVAIILALLLAGIEIINYNSSVTIDSVSLTPENQVKVDQLKETIKQTTISIQKQTAYLENSILMSIDPYEVHSATVHIFIWPDTADSDINSYILGEAIARAYYSYLVSDEAMLALSDVVDTDPFYIYELIAVDSTSYSNCLGITVRERNAQNVQAIVDEMLALLDSQTETISQTVDSHTLTVIRNDLCIRQQTALADTQRAARQVLTTLNNTLAASTTELNKLQPSKLTAGNPNPVLHAIVGAVLGVCLVAGYAWISHIFGGKIYSAKVLANKTGIRILGSICGTKKFDPITRWLRKLEGRADHNSLDSIAINIRNRCENISNLLVVGTYTNDELLLLPETLERFGIRCTLCGTLGNSAEAMVALPNCDAVVLAETCSQSLYDCVTWTMQTVQDLNKPLLGCILING